ncbi:MAG TPA: flagellar biosynthetic protein FliR [Vicinamibacterales bacterium]
MIDLSPLVRFGLVLVRTGTLVGFAPVFGGFFAPSSIKVGLSVVVAAVLVPVVTLPAMLTVGSLVLVVMREFAIGLALSLSVSLVIGAVEFAGYLTGFQLGYSYAAIVDPQTGIQNNVVATAYSSLALLVFLAIDGHHEVLRALAMSYRALPMGAGHVGGGLVTIVTQMIGLVFTEGVQLAAPVIIVLLVLQLAIGLLSRVAPMLNVLVVGYPLQLLVGLLALAAAIRMVPAVTSDTFRHSLEMAVHLAEVFR